MSACLRGEHVILLIVSLWLLAGCSLSAPPPARGNAPILTPLPPQTDVEVQLPSRKPSAARGALIYAEKCVACHGPSGRGDGPDAATIQAQVGVTPADLTADSVVRASTPAEWFTIISAGRLERRMPPFSGSLSVDDRWDVIAYAWSLGSPDSKLAAGQAIYAERCAQCHGQTGQGDGPQSDGQVPDLSTLAPYQDVAPGEWDNALRSGHVPSFSGKLGSADRSAVIDYLRSFAYDATLLVAGPGPDATPVAPATAEPARAGSVLVEGSVSNGTAGGPQPGNLEGIFFYFPGGFENVPVTRTVQIDADGRFSVPDLAAQPGDVVGASVPYGDITYTSEALDITETGASIALPIRVYEQTTDTRAIRIEVLHTIVTQEGGALNVAEVYVVSNLGDHAVANTTGEPTLRFTLPPQATAFQGMSTIPGVYEQTPDGFGYYEAVLPGEGTADIRVAYQLPLEVSVSLDRTPTYPIGSVDVLVQSGDLEPSSDQLIDQGASEFQGRVFQVFSGGPFGAGRPLTFRLASPSTGPDAKLIGGIAMLIAGVGVVGYGLWRTRPRQTKPRPEQAVRRRASTSAEREQLLDQIAALDDAFEAGEVAEADYRRQREALKARALRLMREE